ncbi:MAG: FMN-binding negative transcriptional regulator [Acidimicrobiia bacterium]
MLIHGHDRDDDPQRWRSFLEQQGFGHLVAAGSDRAVPVVVPTQFVLADTEILFHLVATNPIFDALAENERAMLSIAGDWAFIPGSWKAIGDEDPRRGIPTTYYAAVQVTGTCEIETKPDDVASVLATQLAALDPDGEYVDPREHGARLRAIRGIRLSIEDVRAKYKYGGNVDQPHRDAVAELLAARDGPGDRAALEHLRRVR